MPVNFHMLMKPIGPRCNMKCSYCFYSEKAALYPDESNWRISDALLERFISGYISDSCGNEVSFVWQGGEPLLMGITFYEKVIILQRKYAVGKTIRNSIQTNGTLLNPDWCRFLKKNNFLVGISLDGPAEIHNRYRSLRSGKPSFAAVMNGVRLLQKYQVDFNVTACVTQESAEQPLTVYHFFKEIGANYIQFAPIIERVPCNQERNAGLWHAKPDRQRSEAPQMLQGSVAPESYGKFLCTIFDEWIKNDIGDIFVMNFEWALERWLNLPSSYCLFGKQCGNALAVEHNGDVYSCDHYVYPEYLVGNIAEASMEGLVEASMAGPLAKRKDDLTAECLSCPYRFACEGECPKNRFIPTADGKGINYLCKGYRLYFAHIAPSMEKLAALMREGKPAYTIRSK